MGIISITAKKHSVAKDTALYTVALILPQITGFLLLPLYTKYLSPADYAITALVNSFTAIIGVFIALQLGNGIGRYVLQFMAKKQEREAKIFFTSVFVAIFAVAAMIFFLLEIFGDSLVKITFPNNNMPYHPYYQLSLLSVIFIAFYQVPQAVFKSLRMSKQFLTLSATSLVITIAFNVYFLVFRHMGVYGIFLGGAIGSFIGALMSFWYIKGWFCRGFSWNYVTLALRYSLPLIPHMLGVYLFTTSNRIILEKYVSMTDIGIFSLADKLSTVPLFFVNAFNMAYNPEFIHMAETDEKKAVDYNRQVIAYWWAGVVFIVLGFILFSSDILNVMATKRYYPAIGAASILVLSCIFRGLYCYAVSPLFFYKKTYWIPVITVVAGAASVILNVIVIPEYGITGACWVTVFSYLITFVMAEALGRRFLKINYPWKIISFVGGTGLLIVAIVKWYAYAYMPGNIHAITIEIAGMVIFASAAIYSLGLNRKLINMWPGKKALGA